MHLILEGRGGDWHKLQDLPALYELLDTLPGRINMTKIMPPIVTRYVGVTPEDWGISGFVSVRNLTDEHFIGSARFDRKRGRFVAFEVVAVGTRRGGTQYNGRGNDLAPAPFGAVLSLAGESRAERVAPEHFGGYGWR